LVCLFVAVTPLAAMPTVAAAADVPCARYAGAPERVRGGDDNTPDLVRVSASAVSCPDGVSVQITACLQRQDAGAWVDVGCATSIRAEITRFTRGARGVGLTFDGACLPGVLRTHVAGGEGLQPTEWDSAAVTIACNVHDSPTDTTPPRAAISSGPSRVTRDASPTLSFVSSEANSTFECRLDAPGWTACASPTAYDALADGDYVFRVRATDLAGNISTEAILRFTVDTTPPLVVIESGPSGAVGVTSATFAFSSEAGVSFECRLDVEAWTSCTSPVGYSDLAQGEHRVSVRGSDAAGNVGPEAVRTWTVAPSQPATEPPESPALQTSTLDARSTPAPSGLLPAPGSSAAPSLGARPRPALRLPKRLGVLTATRTDVVKVPLGTCQADAAGTLSIRAGFQFGHASFTARAGQRVVVAVQLSRRAAAVLRRRGRLRVRATAALQDAAGTASTTAFSFTLNAARR
jgi:hypothetical protein